MGRTAVIVVDMLNPYEHEDADVLAEAVKQIIDPLSDLLDRAGREGVDVIYVNDNYGDWSASRETLIEKALAGRHPELVEPVVPADGANLVFKARHSIFYGTPLEYLLGQREIDHLVLAGQVTEQCILYSALDAYVRHLRATIPPDGVAAIREDLAGAALEMMERNMQAELAPCAECTLKRA
jgi:nicotinamidase-related amidase